MNLTNFLQYTAITFIIFLVLDAIWMWLVSKSIYQNELGDLLKPKPIYWLHILAEIILAAGLVYFVTQPAIVNVTIATSILGGLLFGFIVGSIYAITNLAQLKNWSVLITLIDITWISFLSAVTSLITYLIFA